MSIRQVGKRLLKKRLTRLHWFLSSQIGFDPYLLLRSVHASPWYIRDLLAFRRSFDVVMNLRPCLHDKHDEGGSIRNEYFWQDLLVARWVHDAKPVRHVDVGSRVDGLVAHIAAFRTVEVFDIRPLVARIPGVLFRRLDVMDAAAVATTLAGGAGYCDSLSCLHALEHFGLGRYGDPLDPLGYEKGFGNMATLLQSGGLMYLAVPIGRERVEFNSHWVFAPSTILRLARKFELSFKHLTTIRDGRDLQQFADTSAFEMLGEQDYSLGIFVLQKNLSKDGDASGCGSTTIGC